MSNGKGPVEAPPLPPIELIEPDVAVPAPRRSRFDVALETIKAAPNLAKLCARLLRDPRVPRRNKFLVGAAGAYLLSPIDLIPELLLPLLGRVDDLLLLAYVLHRLLDAVEPEVLEQYWDGDEDALELVTAIIAWGADLMPGPVKRLLG